MLKSQQEKKRDTEKLTMTTKRQKMEAKESTPEMTATETLNQHVTGQRSTKGKEFAINFNSFFSLKMNNGAL